MNFLCSISAIVMYLIIQNYINNYRPFCVFLWCLMVLHFCSVMANESSKGFFAAKKKRFLHGLPPNVNAVEIGISYVAMCTERLFLLSTNACFINKTFSKTLFYCWCKIIKLLSSACLKWLLIYVTAVRHWSAVWENLPINQQIGQSSRYYRTLTVP